ncbi:MAG: XRE family transcriptional regulator [Bacteroidota bacterium]|nr:XRE family transcriptional regulator [Bacteroidota bacterium]
MQDDLLIQVSSAIRELRKQKNITIQELADKANVSKGLISQVENNRTVPSLPVFMNIVKSLGMDLTDFFKDIPTGNNGQKVIIKRAQDYQHFEKEHAKGFNYKRILTCTVNDHPVDIVLLELKKGAKRNKSVKTDAFEYKYIIRGKIEHLIDNETYILEEGDSIFFDGRMGHNPSNVGEDDALLLVVYFFNTNDRKV